MNITRRFFLGRASTAAIVPVVGLAPAHAVGPDENPELVRLDAAFRQATLEYEAAHERKQAARAYYEAHCPPVPAELVYRRSEHGAALGEDEVDVEGNRVWPVDPKQMPRRIMHSELIAQFQMPFDTTRHSRRWRAIYETAVAYEAATKATREASGIYSAMVDRHLKVDELRRLFWDIAKQEARTLAGLMTKANAIRVYANCGPEEAWSAKSIMGDGLATDVLAVLGDRRAAA